MKLSIVILCWNDRGVIENCLRSIYEGTHSTSIEVIVSDNGSTDGSIELIREKFPQVRLLENGTNLRFAKGNNVGFRESTGEYVLILNPDTIIHDETLDKMVRFADKHTEAGAFGCRVLSSDGSYQGCIRPLDTPRSEWFAALGLGFLGHISDRFHPGVYVNWHGDTERTVGWLAGCFILIRGELLRKLGGFDEQFFYYYEDADLCRRVWEAGYTILYTPTATITHLGGESTHKRFPPLGFALDGQVTRYLYFSKYYGVVGVRRCRRSVLVSLFLRRTGYGVLQLLKPTKSRQKHVELLRALFDWNIRVDPARLVEHGEEPEMAFDVTRVRER